jgi:RNA polymerase sigma-70 factor (ECF subfamily)
MSSHDPTPSASTSLLVDLRRGNADAWRRWTYLFGPVVHDWCRAAGLQEQDAADVAQEVFAAVMAGLANFRRDQPGATFRGWLWTVTRNKVRDFWRRRGQQPQGAGGSEAQLRLAELPEELSEDGSRAVETTRGSGFFQRALELIENNFEYRTWQAFWRTTIDEQPATEVAAALGMSAGAVYVAKSRVLARLREELGELIE